MGLGYSERLGGISAGVGAWYSLGGVSSGSMGLAGRQPALRYFTELKAANLQSWTPDTTVTLTGDFKVTVTCMAIGGAALELVGTSANAGSIITARTDLMKGFINFNDIGVAGTYDLKDGEFSDWEFERSGTTFTWKQDGVTLATNASVPTDVFFIDSIGNMGGNHGTGIYSDLKVYDAGTLIHSWAMDEQDPSKIVDTISGNDGTGSNLSVANTDLYAYVEGVWVLATSLDNYRYFTSLLPASAQSWNVPDFTLTGDFKMKALVKNTAGENITLMGTRSVFTSFCSMSITRLSCTVSGAVNRVDGTFDLRDGEWVTAEIERVGTVITWKLDGVTLGTKTGASTNTFTCQRLGEVFGFYHGGGMADFEVYDAGVLIHRWAIDEKDPTTIVDSVGTKDLTALNVDFTDAVLNELVNGVWTPVPAQVPDFDFHRYFTPTVEASQQMWILGADVICPSDFKITFTGKYVAGISMCPLGRSNYATIVNLKTTVFTININSISYPELGTYDLDVGNFNDWEIERIGAVITMKRNGILLASITAVADTFFFDNIAGAGAAHGSPLYRDGVYGDLKVYKEGVLTNHWPMDEKDSSTIVDVVGGNSGTGRNITEPDSVLHEYIDGVWTPS